MQNQDDEQELELEQQPPEQDNNTPARKPGTFTKDDPRINRSGGQSRDQKVPQLLRDLRHVYNRPKSKDKTQGQKMLRKLFEKHPDKFAYRLQRAEVDYGARMGPQAAPEPAVEEVDESEERCIALFVELLKKKPWLQQ
jgi:hypothetical protein